MAMFMLYINIKTFEQLMRRTLQKLIQNDSTGCNRTKQRLNISNNVLFKQFKSIKKYLY